MDTRDVKKTTVLLINIIRTLSQSSNPEQRKGEKQRLEKAYQDSDKNLNGLVQAHMNELTSIIKAFSEISSRVTNAQNRVHAIRHNLQSCKNLLLCKRGELQQLWLDGIECKTTVTMLEQIQEIHNVAEKLHGYMDHKHYLHATQLLVKAASLLQNDLADVGALADLKTELTTKTEEIFDGILDELNKLIYVRSIRGVEKSFQREGSLRQSQRREKMIRNMMASVEQESQAEKQVKQLLSVDLEEVGRPQHVSEDVTMNGEEDPVQYIAVLVECLALLRRLMDSVDMLRGNVKSGLTSIIARASQQVADSAYIEGEDLSQLYQPNLLNDLLSLLYQQFEVVIKVHQIILTNMHRIKKSLPPNEDFELYDITEVWLKMQEVLQQLLSEYLDARHTGSGQTVSTNQYEPNKDLNFYFAKKRQKPQRCALFRFDASSHAMSMTSYWRDQRQDMYNSEELLNRIAEGDGGRPVLVCKPVATNITSIYMPLQKFMKEMEDNLRIPSSTPAPLQAFLTDFVSHIFLTQVREKFAAAIDEVTQGDSRRQIIDSRIQSELSTVPLLQSAMVVAKSVEELQTLMEELANYKAHFVSIACSLLNDYRLHCQLLFDSIIAMDQEERKLISVAWANDEDISRLVKSLPSWSLVKINRQLVPDVPTHMPPRWFGVGVMTVKEHDEREKAEEEEEIHDADQRALMIKETSLLTSNLSSTPPVDTDIIADLSQLQTLASLCESLEWCSLRVEQFIDDLTSVTLPSSSNSNIKNSPSLDSMILAAIQSLKSISKDFQEQSEKCLLVLHLEVRVHCFVHLLPLPKRSNFYCAIDDMDPNDDVKRHNKDLANLEEIMRLRLEPKKFKYIFDGLGHLVSSILINHAQKIARINENGIKKLCRNILALQQCITNITMTRESDLDHARQYYELLYLRPLEITKHIRDRGAKFSEQEYVNLLKLAHRSEKGAKEETLQLALSSLMEALSSAQRR